MIASEAASRLSNSLRLPVIKGLLEQGYGEQGAPCIAPSCPLKSVDTGHTDTDPSNTTVSPISNFGYTNIT